MENYETQFLSITPLEMPAPNGSIPYADLTALISIKTTDAYERELRKLAQKLPFKTSSWPSFGQDSGDGSRVEVGEFKRQLQYCERGSCQVREDCENLIDLSYQVLNIVCPNLSSSAEKIAQNLDCIKDQRLLIWLRMSSEIFHMYQVNSYFGIRMLNANVTWMCEELVRMGVFNNTTDAFKSEKHIVQGLMLSGLPKSIASTFYQQLKKASPAASPDSSSDSEYYTRRKNADETDSGRSATKPHENEVVIHRQINHKTMRVIVGLIALSISPSAYFLSGCPDKLSSISISYWTDAHDIFVGSLVAVGFFLSAYNGAGIKRDMEYYISRAACVFALCVAFFPTVGFNDSNVPAKWVLTITETLGVTPDIVHNLSAVLYFSCLITLICFFSVRAMKKGKAVRAYFYRVLAALMVIGIITLSIIGKVTDWDSTVFWIEVWGLTLFGVGWLVAGSYKAESPSINDLCNNPHE
ncbi:MAG: DUF998 domain-containing protein [Pseudomonadales bacterium]|nr:DUF998 domain-containing protein [Pseudomonadales bacterium]